MNVQLMSGEAPCDSRSHPTMRAPDWWESARFQAVCVAPGWFRQSGVISSRPPAGNASRWAPEGNTVSSLEGRVESLQ